MEEDALRNAAALGYSGVQESAYVLAYQSCTVFTPREVAREFNAQNRDPGSAAEAYAIEMFETEAEIAAFNGCLDAFEATT